MIGEEVLSSLTEGKVEHSQMMIQISCGSDDF